MATRNGNWITMYGEYVKESESPESFHYWTALSVLASVVRRNVWINQELYLMFPGMYVILVGPPATGKSTCIRMGRRLLLEVEDILFGPDSLTREELIRVMSKAGGEGKVSAVTIHSTEMSSFIEPSGIHMMQFLTDIYDGDFKWRYSTKGKGRDTIHNPVLNILAGTTVDYISGGIIAGVVGHGFISRVVFVHEEGPKAPIPFPQKTDPEITNMLVEDLRHISTLKGEFQWDPKARELYAQLYNQTFYSKPADYRIEGFHSRKAKVHLLKVAMLISVSERDELIILPNDIEVAWAYLTGLEDNMPKTFAAVGKYEYAGDYERIVGDIMESDGILLSDIFFRNRAVGDSETIEKILESAERALMIKVERRGKQVWYVPGANAFNGKGGSKDLG